MKALALVALVAGCNFQATPADNRIDASGDGPVFDAPAPDAAIDAVVPDTATPIDARLCYGAGLVRVCFTAQPSGNMNLPTGGQFNTSTGPCNLVVAQQAGPELCVVAAATLTVSGNLVAVGARPLVLVATDTLTVAAPGTVDVSSVSGTGARTGAGGNAPQCSPSGSGQDDPGGGGGGAGGSLGIAGGRGGTGDTNNNDPPGGSSGDGGNPGNAQPNPAVLHGGCAGGAGGDGDNGPRDAGGPGGAGGGAVYLIAGERITIDGSVFASGAGGGVTTGTEGQEEGAGGGGSGGMIVLDAPVMQVNGRVVANGGAGGGGGGLVGGMPGGNGTTLLWNQRAQPGIGDQVAPPTGPAGNGAQGTAAGVTSGLDGGSSPLGAGGGAGGLGVVWTFGTLNGGSMMSPAPVQR